MGALFFTYTVTVSLTDVSQKEGQTNFTCWISVSRTATKGMQTLPGYDR